MSEFAGSGLKEGIEVWRIEQLAPVKLSDGFTAKLHVGDSYIFLVSSMKGSKLSYNAHFWLGSETSLDESGVAAYKTVELDDHLGGSAVQYREVQGSESQLFLSYFKGLGGVQYCPGGVASGFRKVEVDVYPTRLLRIKGKRTAKSEEVKLQRSSLNKSDAFILDKGLKIFVFCGPEANKFEKAKAINVADSIDGNERGGRASIIFLDDDMQNSEFWNEFGGFVDPASLPAGPLDESDVVAKETSSLYRLSAESGAATVTLVAEGRTNLLKSALSSEDVFILINSSKVFIWVGKGASVAEKREAMPRALLVMKDQGIAANVPVERVSEGQESSVFKSEFSSWPVTQASAALPESAIDVKSIAFGSSSNARAEAPVDDGSGKTQIWIVKDMKLEPVPAEQYGQFYAGDSYVIQYTYTKKGTENWILYFWQGKDSSADERGASALLTKELDDRLGGKAVQVRVVQGKEPAHFKQIFKGRMIIHFGGIKKSTTVSAASDTRDVDGVALFQIRSADNALNSLAIQVQERASSLHSRDTFLLVNQSHIFTWYGVFSNASEKQSALGYAHVLAASYLNSSGRSIVEVSEGQEPGEFWEFIGGQGEYTKVFVSTELPEPRLFEASTATGRFKVEEIVSFDQTDLNSEDVFLLDTATQLFVWVGSQSSRDEKAKAEEFARQYVATVGGDPDVSTCIINSGQEPAMFTEHFVNWDDSLLTKSSFVDPYEAKIAEMKKKKEASAGPTTAATAAAAAKTSTGGGGGGGGGGGRGRAAPAPAVNKPNPAPETPAAAAAAPVPVTGTFSLAELKAGVPAGCDPSRKEEYLSPAEFINALGMDKAAFAALPGWKRNDAKKKAGIF